VIEILKRSILISGMAIFGQLIPGAELLAGTLLSVMFCLEQGSLQPYLRRITNKTKIWVDVVVATTMLSMLTLTVDTNEYDKNMVDWLIGVTNFFLLWVVVWFSWQTLRLTVLKGPGMVRLRIKGAQLPHPTDQLLWLVRVWRIVRRMEIVYLKSKAPQTPREDLTEVAPTEGGEGRDEDGGGSEVAQSDMSAWVSLGAVQSSIRGIASTTHRDSDAEPPTLLPGTFVGKAETVEESVKLISSVLPAGSLFSLPLARSPVSGTSKTTMETVAASLGMLPPKKDKFRSAQGLIDFLSSQPGVTGVAINNPTAPQQDKPPPPRPRTEQSAVGLNVIEDLVSSDPVFRRWQSTATIKKTRGVVKSVSSVSSWRPTPTEPLVPVAELDVNEAMQAWEEEVAREESEQPMIPARSDHWITELDIPELEAMVSMNSIVGLDPSSPSQGDAK